VLRGAEFCPLQRCAARLPEQPPALGDHLLLYIPKGKICDPEAHTVRFILILLLACFSAGAEEAPPDLLVDAGQCLGTAKQDPLDLAHRNAATVELGSVTVAAAHRGEQMLYVVDYITPYHSEGTVFLVLVEGDKHRRVLRLLFPTRFRQVFFPDAGSQRIELVDPPFGGIGTQDGIISAIRQVGFETFKIPVTQLQKPPDSVSCESENELP
jgi:hypothetical protein